MAQFKKGDRVRWTGAYDLSLAKPEAIGTTGTVQSDSSPHRNTTQVKWDIDETQRSVLGLGTGIFNGNLEFINMIDTTKPLELCGRGITFITNTSDGNILVEVNGYGWAIFDQQGKFVRSKSGTYTSVLRNKVERHVVYQALAQVTQGYIMNTVYDTEAQAGYHGKQVVRVTSENGRVVSVELM